MLTLPNLLPQAVPGPQPLTLAEVAEGQEIPNLAPSVTWQETTALKTVAGMTLFSRQAIQNADWGVLNTIAEEMLDAAYRAERDEVFALLAANPTMSDGVAWFDSSRGNISAVTGAPSVSTMEAAISALRRLGGSGIALGLPPSFIVTPDNLEVATSVLLQAGVNLVFSKDRPSLAASSLSSAWFVLPDPAARPAVGLCHLPGGVGTGC